MRLKIVFIRHGEYHENGSRQGYLTEDGRANSQGLAINLQLEHRIQPGTILSSNLTRAKETANAAAEVFNYEADQEIVPEIYADLSRYDKVDVEAFKAKVLSMMKGNALLQASGALVVVAHEPTIEKLTKEIGKKAISLKKAHGVVMTVDTNHWEDSDVELGEVISPN